MAGGKPRTGSRSQESGTAVPILTPQSCPVKPSRNAPDSIRWLASAIANEMAENEFRPLPRVTSWATSACGRDYLAAYYHLLDNVDRIRAAESAVMTVMDRVVTALVREQLVAAIEDTKAWLTRTARRGGSKAVTP